MTTTIKSRIRYGIDHNGVISRYNVPGALGTQWVSYIRLSGDRAMSIGWTDKASEATRGYDWHTFRAVQNFNKRKAS